MILHPCSSDVHFWHSGCIGPMIVEDKHILGHESAGEVSRMTYNLSIGNHEQPLCTRSSPSIRP
jgi:D-arabinose 1-dehydrogenase-like Zn-dependent alcohol dehydrogenase